MTRAGQDMKSLLYGCEEDLIRSPLTPGGKKRLVTDAAEVPFATTEQDPAKIFSRGYVKKHAKRHVHEKVHLRRFDTVRQEAKIQVGAARLFDPSVYVSNYERILSNRKDSSLRNFEGNGDILAHQTHPPISRPVAEEKQEDATSSECPEDARSEISTPPLVPTASS